VVISRRGAARLRRGHPWIYRSDVARTPKLHPGSLVAVRDPGGNPLGIALYSTSSEIALRWFATPPPAGGEGFHQLLHQRIAAAVEYRQWLVTDSDAYRVVFSEADFLPGLIVDRYHDLLSLQALTQAMDRPEVRQVILAALQELIAPQAILERVDPRIRQLEHLPPLEPRLLRGSKSSTVFTMNRLRFHFDGLRGQKTGAFLDQRENYVAAERYAHGEALDVFCYQGGFALHLARRCSRVTAVDGSRPALEAGEQNAALNARPGMPEIEWIEANAFDLLKDYAAAGRQYDTLVLDPPAFAKNRSTVPAALRGYKELNLRALKMLRPGGLLVTCSCSYHVSETDFLEMLGAAAIDAHRASTLRILEKRGQARDHPCVLTIPETAYLKCVLARV